jgi:hypothetical protein
MSLAIPLDAISLAISLITLVAVIILYREIRKIDR